MEPRKPEKNSSNNNRVMFREKNTPIKVSESYIYLIYNMKKKRNFE